MSVLWPLVTLALGAGAFVLGWRLLDQREERESEWIEAYTELEARVIANEGKAQTVATDLGDRVKHLEALQPDYEGQRRTRRLG